MKPCIDIKSTQKLTPLTKKRVLLRLDLNVPVKLGKVLDEFKLKLAEESVRQILSFTDDLHIISHIGRSAEDSLAPVFKLFKKSFPEARFVEKENYFERKTPGLYFYENLRLFEGELSCDEKFALRLAGIADIFVQDAFAALHRKHASIVKLPKFLPAFCGFILTRELEHLSKALKPRGVSVAILGGSKLKSKEPLIKKLLANYDKVLLVGALANEILCAQGMTLGKSKVEDCRASDEILNADNLFLPNRYIVKSAGGELRESDGSDIKTGEMIADSLVPADFLKGVDFALWNGPPGIYEDSFLEGAKSLFKEVEKHAPFFLVGGGDSNAVLDKLNAQHLASFRSSGGGAMLEYLLNEDLPGLRALKESQSARLQRAAKELF